VAAFVRAYANLANELAEAGFSQKDVETLEAEVGHYEKVRTEVKLASGDYIDLKMYEPAMRHLIDTYIRAEESEKVASFDDVPLVQLIVERGAGAVNALPDGIRKNKEAVAEAIENNVRRLIIDEQPINPKYYEKMSELLDALIEQRRKKALAYQEYLQTIIELAKKAKNPEAGGTYPKAVNSPGRRALYDNLNKSVALALVVDEAVRKSRQDDWRANPLKTKLVRNAIKAVLKEDQATTDRILEIVKNQNEY
jgi:type I restriction enzyme R subunit